MVETGLHALATTLLILPGFASDLVGLALKAPSIRAGLAKRLRGQSERRGPRTIDLKPNEWKSLDAPRKRRRVAKPTGAPPAARVSGAAAVLLTHAKPAEPGFRFARLRRGPT